MGSRQELKASFIAGRTLVESDFTLLIDSLAHLNDDLNSGALASGAEVSELKATMNTLTELANSVRGDMDAHKLLYPTLAQVQSGDAEAVSIFNDRISSLGQAVASTIEAVDAKQDVLELVVEDIELSVKATNDNINNKLDNLPDYATNALLDVKVRDLSSLIDEKSNVAHSHSQYLTNSDVSNFLELGDLSGLAQEGHSHLAEEITGLDDLFMTPAETQSLIQDNKVTLDPTAILLDNFYDKEEVDQKFYVARWRTDQVSLFVPSVVSICTPIVSLAKAGLEVSIANVRASVYQDRLSMLSHVAQTRAEVEVSIFQNKNRLLDFDVSISSIRASIYTQGVKKSLSIASSQAYVIGELATARAELNADIVTNAQDIDQSLLDAKGYADDKISSLINGAGAAWDTLKELQDALIAGDLSLAASLNQKIANLVGQVSANDGDILAIEGRLDTIEPTVSIYGGEIIALKVAFDSQASMLGGLKADNTILTNAISSNSVLISALTTRLKTLEDTAYANAGYTFP